MNNPFEDIHDTNSGFFGISVKHLAYAFTGSRNGSQDVYAALRMLARLGRGDLTGFLGGRHFKEYWKIDPLLGPIVGCIDWDEHFGILRDMANDYLDGGKRYLMTGKGENQNGKLSR